MIDRHAVNNFAQKVQGLIEEANAARGPSPRPPHRQVVKVSFGRRNARIYTEGTQTLCWGWVDMTDGTLRRGSWKAPDMRVPGRGKITDPDIMSKCAWTGPKYMGEIK